MGCEKARHEEVPACAPHHTYARMECNSVCQHAEFHLWCSTFVQAPAVVYYNAMHAIHDTLNIAFTEALVGLWSALGKTPLRVAQTRVV